MNFWLLRISEMPVRTCLDVGRDNVVGIAIQCGLGVPLFDPRWGERDFLFSKIRPDQPWGPGILFKCVLGLFPCVVLIIPPPPPSSAEFKAENSCTSTPPLCRMSRYGEKFTNVVT
jgi:hypothetical protein